ncbi:putative ABC transport system permease protein [Microbacterium resistens]|uniref:ABC transport system permease protein n=1 Tax=Microbacterium resistens TaxID=156977 RepID=A0ABU1SAX6_9MICO|nr:FtsX-like permease family protein [Microbacterium resistens]MDR6866017.1 putative ABC transport system permease protein [Microbacterium resistens]
MIRLLAAELRLEWRSWAGLVLVAAVGSLALGVGGSMLETGITAGGRYAIGFGGAASMVLVFSGASAVAVTAAVARLAVDLGRASYARWLLAGAGPRQVGGIVSMQVAVMSLLGALAGLAATSLVAAPVVHGAFEGGSGGYQEVPVVVGPLTALFAVGGILLVALLGGLSAARRAARTPPLDALREPEAQGRRMRWWRWGLFAAMVAAATAACVSWLSLAAVATDDDRNTLISQTPLIAPLLSLVVVSGGPVLYGAVLRAWTALIPARASSAWFLARHQARYHLGRSTASVTPLFTGTAMVGGLYTVTAIWGDAARASGESFNGLQLGQVIVLLGGPVLLATVGAAVVVFMSNRAQAREQALLSASGATTDVILRAAVWQAMIHVLTAAILAIGVIVVTGLLASVMLAPFYPVVALRYDLAGTAAILALGLVLTVAAVALPVAARLREPVATALAVT